MKRFSGNALKGTFCLLTIPSLFKTIKTVLNHDWIPGAWSVQLYGGEYKISCTTSCFHRRVLRNNGDERWRYRGKTCTISRGTSPVSNRLADTSRRGGEGATGSSRAQASSLCDLGSRFGSMPRREAWAAHQHLVCHWLWHDPGIAALGFPVVPLAFRCPVPSGWQWQLCVVTASIVDSYEPMSNLHPTFKGKTAALKAAQAYLKQIQDLD